MCLARSPLLRAVLLATLLCLQLIAPLLHGHIGFSEIHGWHIHTLAIDATDSHCIESSPEPTLKVSAVEPREVDVETGALTGAELRLVDALAAVLFAVLPCLAAALLFLHAVARPRADVPLPLRRLWRPGGSPPALAPPLTV